METKPVRVGIYARISEDRDGQQTATARQLKDAREFAERKGWIVVDEFEDIDTSAFKTNVKRPEFLRMLDSLRVGEIDGVLVWKLDRLTRQQRDLARVMEACEVHKAFVASVSEPIDTHENYGQFVAELLVAQARMESANTSARQRRKAQEMREEGRPPSVGRRCFGYALDLSMIVPEEAALLRDARDSLLAGESLRGVVQEWNVRGVRTTRGAEWRTQYLSRLLASPTLCAEREHEGLRYPGTWPAIFTPNDTERLRRLFAGHAGAGRKRSPTVNLLSGVLRCGACGEGMYGSRTSDGKRRYVCHKRPGSPACGSLTTMAVPVEEAVAELVFAAVDGEALARALHERTDHDDGLAGLVRDDEAALKLLSMDYYDSHVITRDEFFAAREPLVKRLEANRERLSRRDRGGLLHRFTGSSDVLRNAWTNGNLEFRRAIVGGLLERVELLPASKKGRSPFDVGRVRPRWRY
jgi:site-specific DNA recombinase